ncbi:MAG: lysophospholipid acyltransferase family protein [Deltaproteobacteria bacterium]|nr:lysophospholipid acyltransferase family protein [Deltaproteobacteria bacterium]
MSASRALGRAALAPASGALYVLAAAVEGLDYEAALELGRALGRIWYHALPIRRSTIVSALGASFPTWSAEQAAATARSVMCLCASNVITLLWATADSTRPRDILDVVRFEGLEHYEREADRGVVLATTHTGNWDLAALAACARGVELTVVSRNLSYGPLDRMWRRRRAAAGVTLLDESRGLNAVLGALQPGRALALMIDQRTGPDLAGIRLPFLGREAWTSTLPAAVALRRTRAIVPITSRVDEDSRLVIRVHEPVEPGTRGTAMDRIRGVTATLSRTLEDWIRLHPDSWLWLHRRWAEEPAHR